MKAFRKLLIPYLIWGSLIIVIPMLLIILYAFTKPGNNVVSLQFTLDNFLRFFTDEVFISVLLKSLRIAFVTTVICFLIGYPVAYAISKKSEKTQLMLILLITIPMWINTLIRTYSWISVLDDFGIINNILMFFSLKPITMMYTEFAVQLGMVYNFLPFMIIQVYTSLSKMDQSLIDASYDLGANRLKTFLKITFPLSLPGVISGITLVFLPAVSTFSIPALLGGGQYALIGSLIEKQFINVGDWNFGSAISLIMALIILLSMYLTQYFDTDKAMVKKEVNNGRAQA